MNSLEVQMALLPGQGVIRQPMPERQDNSAKLVNELQKQIDSMRKDQAHSNAIKNVFGGSGASGSDTPAPADSRGKKRRAAQQKGEPDQPPKPAPNAPGAAPRLPPGLEGCSARSSAATGRKRMCFAFNQSGCKAVKPGVSCSRGAHLCMRTVNGEACSMPHAQNACTR